jgi:hypothetical protein
VLVAVQGKGEVATVQPSWWCSKVFNNQDSGGLNLRGRFRAEMPIHAASQLAMRLLPVRCSWHGSTAPAPS